MSTFRSEPLEMTYPLRTAARLTGLSPELLRAWERRYGAVRPERTPGGSRRYTAADLERLRLLKEAVDAGHRIGELANLPDGELQRRVETRQPVSSQSALAQRLDEIFVALSRLDAAELHRLLSLQLSALGPLRFAREIALPLVQEIGERWAVQRLGIASEHLASGMLAAMFGSALQHGAAATLGPRIVFATPPGERHELGLQMAALAALGAGAKPVYLGLELPADELLAAVAATDAAALALGLVTVPAEEARRIVTSLRAGLAPGVTLWLGGAGARFLERAPGIEILESLEAVERRVALMLAAGARAR